MLNKLGLGKVALSEKLLFVSITLGTSLLSFNPARAGRGQGAAPVQPMQSVREFKRRFDVAAADYQARRYSEALDELKQLLRKSPESFEVNELTGLVYIGLGKEEGANAYLAKAVRLNPQSAPAQTALAANLMSLHRPKEAEPHFRMAAELEPRSYDANHNLGEYYVQIGRLAESIPYLQQAQQIKPMAYDNGYDLALALVRTGRVDEARLQLQSLLKLQDTGELHSLLGEVEEKAKNYVAAGQQYELAARLDPSESNIFNWGVELLLHQTLEPAIAVFKAGLGRHPQSAQLYIGLGIAYYGRAHYDEGARALCQAADLKPKDPFPYTLLGRACQVVSPTMADEVKAHLRRFVKLAPRNASAPYYYATCLWQRDQGQQDPARLVEIESLLKSAISLDPQYADAYLQLGLLYVGQHKYNAAISQYRRALKVNSSLADAHYRLGQALVRMGDTKRAQQEFAVFEQLHKQEVAEADKQRSEIQTFVYNMRAAEGSGGP